MRRNDPGRLHAAADDHAHVMWRAVIILAIAATGVDFG